MTTEQDVWCDNCVNSISCGFLGRCMKKPEPKKCRLCGRKDFGEGSICQTCANLNSL